jgi:DNA-binding HxlR family transcriptional regulator
VPGISKRVLAQQLRHLERDGIVARRVYDQSPPRVEYSLTDFGRTLEPVMERLCEWGETYAAHFAGSN